MLMPNVICATEGLDLVQIQTSAVEDSVQGGFALAAFRLEASGPPYNEQKKEGELAPFITVGPWVLFGVPTDYEVNFSGTGQTPTGSPVNTWLDFSLTRTWQLTANNVFREFSGTISLRRASDAYVLLDQPLRITADGSP